MAVTRCAACSTEEYMPFVCKFCRQKFCAAHRLPENHACAGLEQHRVRARAEGRLLTPDALEREPMRPQVRRSAAWGAGLGRLFARAEGRMAYVLLGAIVATFVLQLIVLAALGDGSHNYLFTLDRAWYLHPWVLLTSIFAHNPSGLLHILLNAMVLYFFGPSLEGLLGTRRFTWLFLGAGLLGGLGYIYLDMVLPASLQANRPVLGASGAIMGLLGTLTILAPRLKILLFFVIETPLWLVTVLFALIDVWGALTPGGAVANLAHLSGLTVGLAYGKRLHDRGLRAHIRQAPSRFRQG